jgi:hypothetical protein
MKIFFPIFKSKDKKEVTVEDLGSMTCKCIDASDWPHHGRVVELERISNGLSKLMEIEDIAKPFLTPTASTPDYMRFVGYPIDLRTIQERLDNGYYRHVDAILWDQEECPALSQDH